MSWMISSPLPLCREGVGEQDSLKHLGLLLEIMYVKHLLRVVQIIFPFLLQLRIQTGSRAKVWDTA